MDPVIKVTSHRIESTARAVIPGRMVASTPAPGRTTRCTVKDSTSGPMDGNMSDIMCLIRKKVMVSLTGRMVDSIRATGRMASRRESASITTRRTRSSTASGNKARDSSGSRKMNISPD